MLQAHFVPIFFDKIFKPADLVACFRAVIVVIYLELFIIQTAFLQINFSIDIALICLPRSSDINVQNALYFDELEEIKNLKGFRYALVFCDKSELLNVLNQSKEQAGLF